MSQPRSPSLPRPDVSLGDLQNEDLPDEPSTPRSILACQRQGIDPTELVNTDIETHRKADDTKFVLEKRRDHYERIRVRKLDDVLNEYAAVLEEEKVEEGGGDFQTQLAEAKMKRIEEVENRRSAAKKEKQRKEIQNMIFQQKRAVEIEAAVAKQEADEAAKNAKLEREIQERRLAQAK